VDFAANGGKVAVFVSFTTFAICRKSKIVMQNLLNELKSLLAEQPRFTLEGRMIKQAVIDAESKEFGMSETVKAVMTVFYNLKTHAQ
jgi:peroxiredoxin family protein